MRSSPTGLVVGAIAGEGIGEEVVAAALLVLQRVAEASGLRLEVRRGGEIGRDAERLHGVPLPPETVSFCERVFCDGGAVLCGPGGGRFVYDIRRHFALNFKISPLRAKDGLADASRMKPEWLREVDILLARENCGGIYQGLWGESEGDTAEEREAHHRFAYTEAQVHEFLTAAARLARSRTSRLTVAWKESGVPSISRLWHRCMQQIAEAEGVVYSMVDIDLLAYRLISEPQVFDVIATPNLFGDVLGDLGAVLLGSRGISYSGNYSRTGRAVYQTNHGAAYDLKGARVANPAGQIFSAAMMLRETFGLWREAEAVESAVSQVWSEGWRTKDVAVPGCRILSTGEIAGMIAEKASAFLGSDSMAPAQHLETR